MKTAYTDEEIRQRMGRLLDNGRMTLPEWEFVKRRGYVEEFRDTLEECASAGEVALEEELSEIARNAAQILSDYREVLSEATSGNSPLRGQPMARRLEHPLGEGDDTPREVLLSYAVASFAAEDPEVRAIREELGHPENFLTHYYEEDIPRNTAEWIEQQWRYEPWPEGIAAEDALPMLQFAAYPNVHWNPDRAEYEAIPAPVQALRVVPGGLLDRLRQLAVRLAREYHWDQIAAVNFILTDDAPINPPVAITFDWCEHVPVQSRIVLVVDPTVTPQELSAQYQAARRQIVGDAFPRALDRKTLWLAARTAGKTATTSVSMLMSIWNDEMGWMPRPWRRGWIYRDKERFARDRRRAEQRVLRPGYRAPTDSVAPSLSAPQATTEQTGRQHERARF